MQHSPIGNLHVVNGASLDPWLASYPQGLRWDAALSPEPVTATMDRAVARFGSRTATSFLGKTMTYAELGAAISRAAKGLAAMGVKRGVNVGLLLPNCPAFIIYYYAILRAGGTVVNFNPLYTVEELSGQVRDSQVAMMVTLDLQATFPKAEALMRAGVLPKTIVCPFKDQLPGLKSVLFSALKGKEVAKWRASDQAGKVTLSADVMNNDGAFSPPALNVADVAVLQYTGGTTGASKGAMLTHANLSSNVQQIQLWFAGARAGEEVFICVIPFFHVFAMTGLMNYAVAMGATMVMLPRFEINATLKLINAAKPTVMAGVPTLYNALMNSPSIKKYDLSSLRYCISGGAPLPIEVKRGFEKVSGCKLVEGYGLSETSPVATINPPDGPVKEGSIGLPVPGTRLSLRSLDDPSVEVPLGEKGEICIAGPQVMKGYWMRPKETADAFVGEFFRTGDVAYMDDEGFSYIVDRIKDMILCSGYNVYPRKIEEALYEHPAVEEVTVIGIPDQYRGEAPKAYVKLRAGQQAAKADLMKHLEPKLSKIEMPADIEFRDALPKTLIGKLSKKELRAELLQKKA
ncbi:MAG: long-chain fatty acid--CoA ligase [Hyphomicrobiales bacterium]|nr:long-chain fatty acid--CoA ligase [Hyphomicrobiales bacterium]